jgi:tetratricopeptide (TPR) repeat protein
LIDAADKLARALRGKAGESLRSVNATPPLAQATTGSLTALRKFSEAVRFNVVGDARAIGLAREAVAADSTFASAWSSLGAFLSNYGGSRSAIDSAVSQAYRYRDRLPDVEKTLVTARYFALGPGRDRGKAIAAYQGLLQRPDTLPPVLVNLAEQLRQRREFARAESLNLAAARMQPGNGTAFGNTVELQLDQGKLKDAAATLVRLAQVSPNYARAKRFDLAFDGGDLATLRSLTDSAMKAGGEARLRGGMRGARALALLDGRLQAHEALTAEQGAAHAVSPADAFLGDVFFELVVVGPSPRLSARLDSAIAKVPFRELPMVDRPYFEAAWLLARTGAAEKARAMVARYQSEMTDTSIRRVQTADYHTVLGEIALAAGKPRDALVEFRRGDIGYDGGPANECAPCAAFNVARAYDAAGVADSAALMFEQYLATPFWQKMKPDLDPVRVPAIRERLGQLYEAMGKSDKAIENYRAFIELWKNADPELQPRVADARKRLARLTPVEKPRP